ncbi:MAG: discoidin domain-containing protein, partial [Sphingobacterium sp.]
MNIKRLLFSIGLLTVTALYIGCKEDTPLYEEATDSTDQVWLSIQRAADGPAELSIFPVGEEDRTETFSVNYGGLGVPASDITVSYQADQVLFDSLNRLQEIRGEEPYEMFPEGSYSLDKTTSVILAGKTQSDIVTMSYKPELFDISKQYLLVISAQNANGYSFHSSGQTIIYTAEATQKVHAKDAWTATASGVEPAEGPDNGMAGAVIDGDANTFWHSPWKDSSPQFPHWLEIDLGGDLYIVEIGLTRRQGDSNGFKTFDIEGSTDGTTWSVLVENGVMDREALDMQVFGIEPQYLKKIR